MFKTEQWMDIQLLHKQGHSIREIARQTGYARNTVRRLLRGQEAPVYQTPRRRSGIDDFKDYLTERFTASGLSAVRLLEELRPMGFTGSLHMVRRFLATLRPQRQALARATLRYDAAGRAGPGRRCS